jgi:hypothetical protein
MENIRRKINIRVYILAFLIVSLFFLAGFIIGDIIAYKKAGTLEVSQRAISAFLDLSNMKGKLFSDDTNLDYCNLSWGDIWNEKVGIGAVLTNLELRLGKDNEKVKEQKKIYNEVQLKTLQLVKQVNEKCDYGWGIILFFYTNDKKDTKGSYDLSERQGEILNTVYERNKDKVKIFSFDTSIGDVNIQFLTTEHNITSTPSLVINGEPYKGFMSRYEIEKVIKK